VSVGCHRNMRETMIEFVVISIVTVFAVLFYIGARYERKHSAKPGARSHNHALAPLVAVSLALVGAVALWRYRALARARR